MTPDAERFDAKTIVLIENITHHMDEEEQDWFPKVRAGLGANSCSTLGADDGAEEDRPDQSGAPNTNAAPARRSARSCSPSTYPVPEHLSVCTP